MMAATNQERWASTPSSSQRRVPGTAFKARVLAECQQMGAPLAAVLQADRLKVSLVRKGLAGRGQKRTGLAVPWSKV